MLPSLWVWVPVIWLPSIPSLLVTNDQFSTCYFHKISFVMWMKTCRICFCLSGSFHFVYCLSITSMFLQMMRFESILWLNHKTWLIEIWLLQVTLKLGQCVLCLRPWVLVRPLKLLSAWLWRWCCGCHSKSLPGKEVLSLKVWAQPSEWLDRKSVCLSPVTQPAIPFPCDFCTCVL